MKKLIYLPLIVGVMATTSCATQPKENKIPGVDLANLDTTYSPKNDFYNYATGGWQKNNPLQPEYARFGTFDQLRENNKEQLRILIEELSTGTHQPGTVAQKIADLYKLGLDSVKLNQEGVAPVKSQLDAISNIQDNKQLSQLLGQMARQGVNPFFYLYVDVDPGNSTANLTQFYQGGMSMGDRDYYLLEDDHSKELRQAFLSYIEKLFVLAGYTEKDAKSSAETVLKIQTQLAKIASSREDLRNPVANYNKMSRKDFEAKFKGIDWPVYFDAAGVAAAQEVSVGQIPFMQGIEKVMASQSLADIKTYLTYEVLDGAANYLGDDFEVASFDFYEKAMSGKQEQQPRWKRSLATTNGVLGEAVGQMYVEKYFPPQAKEKMINLVKNLQIALGERIQNLEWMSDTTKAKAQEKLNTFTVKVGYPDKWRDYSALNIDPNASYYQNVQNASQFEWDYMTSQLGKPVDKEKWHMSPQTVNAYYNPTTNEICFPAAILQPPFFYLDADDAVNYGAIGVVIGHEMTHGFDDQGRQFDKDGNLKDWWTEDDAKRFNERAQGLVAQYDSIKVLGDTHANGTFTLGENIADQGGLLVSYAALQNQLAANPELAKQMIDGFTPDQRFFLAYATLWAGNIRDEEILRLTKIDVHSLGKWRVNGALPNIDAFYQAFDVKEGDKMYLSPNDRVVVW